MHWIAGATVGSTSVGNFDFTSIPQTFTHLQLRLFTRNVGAEVVGEAYTTLNAASTGYNNHLLLGDGSSASGSGNNYTNVMYSSKSIGNSATASVFCVTIIDILDYANTNKYKTIRALSGGDNNGSGFTALGSGLWQSTNAVDRVTFRNNHNLGQYSRADLYGITSNPVSRGA
jgi:hypothetical protein